MVEIIATTPIGKRKAAAAELVQAKGEAAIANLDNHIATLQDSPTNADVIANVVYLDQVMKKVIKYLMNAIED